MERELSKTEIAGLIDHTYLKPDATPQKILTLCQEAHQHGFYAVCVPPAFVRQAAIRLEHSPVRVVTVVGFPLGFNSPETKCFEAQKAVQDGAHEIDLVINTGMLREGSLDYVKNEIDMVIGGLPSGVIVKTIIETGLLTERQKTWAAKLILDTKAQFIKTSTGYAPSGATVEDVRLLKYIVNNNMQIKAAGGIRTLEFAQQLARAGASRLGCSNSLEILSE